MTDAPPIDHPITDASTTIRFMVDSRVAVVANALSVDVEDYYHASLLGPVAPRARWDAFPARVDGMTRRVLDMLAETEARATFFVLGCVAARHPDLVRAIVAGGHELASHGALHYRVTEQSPQAFRRDVADTRKLLEDLGGVPVLGYRAPSFSIDRDTWWAFQELTEAGYRYSSSINPIRHDHYGVPDAPRFPFDPIEGFREIPVGTVDLFGQRWPCGGGGYFRLLPYALSCRAIGAVNRREGKPVVFYFHPWEMDPGQPRLPVPSRRSRFRHYVNVGVMEAKLRRLLDDFVWRRIDEVHPVKP
ncbi:XrtA system polysaccharide deacetylase [Azospirillum canadense]|uniref:XrtA system polysaccharide deacetylase n=1 Tax=Azospirillum canadense TaxID=403962 RepID=UPI0022263A12|nr:XrtA system polysaccharide deacetylase [Azospirillum canadense]MCW2240895.1 polysaccharide deacetylase family protein (PEP-CTERM system associated) [Azospirillum canadense]